MEHLVGASGRAAVTVEASRDAKSHPVKAGEEREAVDLFLEEWLIKALHKFLGSVRRHRLVWTEDAEALDQPQSLQVRHRDIVLGSNLACAPSRRNSRLLSLRSCRWWLVWVGDERLLDVGEEGASHRLLVWVLMCAALPKLQATHLGGDRGKLNRLQHCSLGRRNGLCDLRREAWPNPQRHAAAAEAGKGLAIFSHHLRMLVLGHGGERQRLG